MLETFTKSASKFVFALVAVTACFAFVWGVVTGKVTLDTKDFMILAGAAFTFYFSNKGDANERFLGK